LLTNYNLTTLIASAQRSPDWPSFQVYTPALLWWYPCLCV